MDASPMPSAGYGSQQDIQLDTAALRVLAHPLRLNVLTLLRQRGPATATRIAEELSINPAAASYHLRRLAAGGLIVEEPERGTGRERWWKSAHQQSIHDPTVAAPEEREVSRAYSQAVALACIDRLRRAAAEVPLLPEAWADVVTYSDFVLWLTPADVDRVRTEMFEVISRYRREADAAAVGGAPVSLQVQAFPVPGTVDLVAGDT